MRQKRVDNHITNALSQFGMVRWETKMRRHPLSCILLTLAILIVWYIVAPPKHPQSSRKREIIRPQNAATVTVALDNENPEAMGPLVTYGLNKTIPEFVREHDRGARILLLAYAR